MSPRSGGIQQQAAILFKKSSKQPISLLLYYAGSNYSQIGTKKLQLMLITCTIKKYCVILTLEKDCRLL